MCHAICNILDEELLKCNNRTCIEMSFQLKSAEGKNQLKVLPEQTAAGCPVYIHLSYIVA